MSAGGWHVKLHDDRQHCPCYQDLRPQHCRHHLAAASWDPQDQYVMTEARVLRSGHRGCLAWATWIESFLFQLSCKKRLLQRQSQAGRNLTGNLFYRSRELIEECSREVVYRDTLSCFNCYIVPVSFNLVYGVSLLCQRGDVNISFHLTKHQRKTGEKMFLINTFYIPYRVSQELCSRSSRQELPDQLHMTK